MNRIEELFRKNKGDVCSIFITAGFPSLHDTVKIVEELESAGVDMIELGMPFSDPLADGETIQRSSAKAIENGMNIKLLFEQVKEIRKFSEMPIVLMGYINPVLCYGLERFLEKCEHMGIDGLIIPDISLEAYELTYRGTFEDYSVPLTFLVTPKTSEERLARISAFTKTFIYYVSSSSTTGQKESFSQEQLMQFEEFRRRQLNHPVLMGFGIHNAETFKIACEYFNGGIIGSAFVRELEGRNQIGTFVDELK